MIGAPAPPAPALASAVAAICSTTTVGGGGGGAPHPATAATRRTAATLQIHRIMLPDPTPGGIQCAPDRPPGGSPSVGAKMARQNWRRTDRTRDLGQSLRIWAS